MVGVYREQINLFYHTTTNKSIHIEICRLLYNSFLAIWNDSDKIPSRYKSQAMLPKMKEEKEGLKKVNTKILQMVLFMLYNKAESADKIVGDVNPRGTSKEYRYGTELDRDYNASLNILERGMAGGRDCPLCLLRWNR